MCTKSSAFLKAISVTPWHLMACRDNKKTEKEKIVWDDEPFVLIGSLKSNNKVPFSYYYSCCSLYSHKRKRLYLLSPALCACVHTQRLIAGTHGPCTPWPPLTPLTSFFFKFLVSFFFPRSNQSHTTHMKWLGEITHIAFWVFFLNVSYFASFPAHAHTSNPSFKKQIK